MREVGRVATCVGRVGGRGHGADDCERPSFHAVLSGEWQSGLNLRHWVYTLKDHVLESSGSE